MVWSALFRQAEAAYEENERRRAMFLAGSGDTSSQDSYLSEDGLSYYVSEDDVSYYQQETA